MVDYEARIKQLIKEHPRYRYGKISYNEKTSYTIEDYDGVPIKTSKSQEALWYNFAKYLKQNENR